ncbi:MAG TPA: multidrug effflux MFS transporter [Magnetospirillaceae bacterium]|jgi:DHA1 family bicyclomycin/chloramphenicol resistance-like MFS transporter
MSEEITQSAVAPPRPKAPLWLLGVLTFSGTLAMHIFVPALPVAAISLGVGIPAMQATISLYILGLAFGQLIYGPVSDRFGRRPTLMVGLVIYTIAGFAAVFAADIQTLIVARLFQALGGCAGLVLARAMVRDTSESKDAVRRQALMNLMVTLAPGIGPLVGGLVANTAGWRALLALLCGLGVVNFLLTWRLLPETGRPSRRAGTGLLRSYGYLARSPAFLGFAIGGGCATTSMYAFIAAAPFIFLRELHRSPDEVGPYVSILIFGVWIGSMLASRLIARVPIRRLLIGANSVSVIATLVFLAAVLTGHLSVVLTIVTMFVFTVGVGTAAPAALTEAISVDPAVIGSASGLYGFTQMAVGALCTALVGFGGSPSLAAALVLTGAGIVAQAAFWIAARSQARST